MAPVRRSLWLLCTALAGCSLFPDTPPRVGQDGGAGGTVQTGGAAGSGGTAGGGGAAGTAGEAGQAGAAGSCAKPEPLGATADTYILSNPPNSMHGSEAYIEVSAKSSSAASRALVRFDLSVIPSTAQVVSATLELGVVSDGAADQDVGVHHVLQDWTEEANWQKFDGSSNWNTPGGDVGATVDHVVVAASTAAGTVVTWDVTDDVKGVLGGSLADTGWMLLDENPSQLNGELLRFSSRDAVDPGARPKLTVVYQPNCR
jgi:hypothetical protein